MTALLKDNGRVRGNVTGDTFRRGVARTIAQQSSQTFEEACMPFQYVPICTIDKSRHGLRRTYGEMSHEAHADEKPRLHRWHRRLRPHQEEGHVGRPIPSSVITTAPAACASSSALPIPTRTAQARVPRSRHAACHPQRYHGGCYQLQN